MTDVSEIKKSRARLPKRCTMGSYYEPITLDVYSCSGFAWYGDRTAGRLHAAADAHGLATVRHFATVAAQDGHAACLDGCVTGCVAGRDACPHPAHAPQDD